MNKAVIVFLIVFFLCPFVVYAAKRPREVGEGEVGSAAKVKVMEEEDHAKDIADEEERKKQLEDTENLLQQLDNERHPPLPVGRPVLA